jgi:cellulose synthase/poly-beta-1,6-N-acetylglucosamine synthase-like glycosyltransferase
MRIDNTAACVGSNALYRRDALKEVQGTFAIGYSEDEHTGFQMIKRGWKVKYLPLPMACGTCPDSAQVYFSQQVRFTPFSSLFSPLFV